MSKSEKLILVMKLIVLVLNAMIIGMILQQRLEEKEDDEIE